MHQTQWSAERPLPPPVSLTSQSHHEKPPEVTCTGRGTPGCPASTRERPRETFFNVSISLSLPLSLFNFIYLLVLAVLGLHCGVWASRCGGFSCCGAQSQGVQASVVVVPGFCCPKAHGIFPDQGSNPCPLHLQVDS